MGDIVYIFLLRGRRANQKPEERLFPLQSIKWSLELGPVTGRGSRILSRGVRALDQERRSVDIMKRNRRSLQCLERGHLTWSCSKEYWVTRRVFKLLPMCQNHLRPLMQFPRLETPFFVASMATASNPSKSGFHNKVHIQTHVRSIIQSQERSFSNLDLSDPRPGVDSATTSIVLESKLRHDLATISSFVKPYRRLTTSRRIPWVVLLLWHTRRYGSSYPPSLVVGIRTSHLDAGEHFSLLSTELAPTLYMDRLTKSLQGYTRRLYYSTRRKSTRSQDAVSLWRAKKFRGSHFDLPDLCDAENRTTCLRALPGTMIPASCLLIIW